MMTITTDQDVDVLDLCQPTGLRRFVELLSGQKLAADTTAAQLRLALYAQEVQNGSGLALRELNDLLILLGQNRIGTGFYEAFFAADASLRLSEPQLKTGLRKFRMWALLCAGNFRHPFQEWRRLVIEQIRDCWGLLSRDTNELQTALTTSSRTARIDRIPSTSTYATGVMSAVMVLREFRAALGLCKALEIPFDIAAAKEAAVKAHLMSHDQDLKAQDLAPTQTATIGATWSADRAQAVAGELAKKLSEVADVRQRAIKHTEEYLIAEKIDVYVATSMREDWEFSETAEMLGEIFEKEHPILKHLDYFDPTQSFLESPVDKGLLEGLMLNRVRATLYMAQESDTLGKDSELASTLAQGKPVIAFVPQIIDTARDDLKLTQDDELEVQRWIQKVRPRPLNFFRKRLYLLMGADILTSAEFHALCRANGLDDVTELLEAFINAIGDFDPLFSLISDEHDAFKEKHHWFDSFVRAFVFAEAVNFDKRATVLRQFHPLGLQIAVATGTANGVLVVRTREDCERLLEAVLLNDAEFRIAKEKWGTSLIESISRSRYRVVTDEPVLTAAFWNFFSPVSRSGRSSS